MTANANDNPTQHGSQPAQHRFRDAASMVLSPADSMVSKPDDHTAAKLLAQGLAWVFRHTGLAMLMNTPRKSEMIKRGLGKMAYPDQGNRRGGVCLQQPVCAGE